MPDIPGYFGVSQRQLWLSASVQMEAGFPYKYEPSELQLCEAFNKLSKQSRYHVLKSCVRQLLSYLLKITTREAIENPRSSKAFAILRESFNLSTRSIWSKSKLDGNLSLKFSPRRRRTNPAKSSKLEGTSEGRWQETG
jgi:hypothetical protein